MDTHLQVKPISVSTIPDASISSLVKSSRKYRRNSTDLGTGSIKKSHEDHLDTKRAIVSYKTDEIKKSSKKEREKRESQLEGQDIKKPIVVMATNQEIEVLKGIHEGYEMRRPSVSLAAMNGRGRRRSFCSSQKELADFFSCNGVKVVSVDMPPFMQIHAVDCARKTYDSLEKFTAKTLASTLKKEFDGVYGPAWHCIVGTSFGSFVTHSVGGFLYFSMDHKLYILLFKTTVQKAD